MKDVQVEGEPGRPPSPRPSDPARNVFEYASLPRPPAWRASAARSLLRRLAVVVVAGSLTAACGLFAAFYSFALLARVTGPPQDPLVTAFHCVMAGAIWLGTFCFAKELWYGMTADAEELVDD